MKIIILGAGQVGATLAENLVDEKNEITVVDQDRERLRELQDRFDLQVVNGHASAPNILHRAGAEDADMLIAVTDSDEINMIACRVAYSLFNTPTKVARIRSPHYLKHKEKLFHNNDLPVDFLITPEQEVTKSILRLIEYPGALQVMEFAKGAASLVAVKAYYGGALVGHSLATLRDHMPHIDTRVAAIFRQGRPIRPQGTTIIEADDEVFFIAATAHIRTVMSELQKLEGEYRKIMIAGGGNIGFGLAKALERKHAVKLLERSSARAEHIAGELLQTTVFCGDATNSNLLVEEHIEQTDVFIAVTNDDEVNIMSAMLAKQMGAKKVMVLTQRNAYLDLIQKDNVIDIAISPQQATISSLLTHVRRGDVVNVYSLRRGAAEAIEAIAHGDKSTSRVVGRAIRDIKLPPGTTIGAIVREDEVLIAHDSTMIEQDDHVILFLVNKDYVRDVERLFEPSPFFFF